MKQEIDFLISYHNVEMLELRVTDVEAKLQEIKTKMENYYHLVE